jgi:UDP-N-acetylmuramate--alanine ligase
MEALGATVHIGPHRAENVGYAEMVVTTSAAQSDNPELTEARNRGLPIVKRADMVARLMGTKTSAGIAGCHGKSTTSGMVAYILVSAGRDPTYLIGAEVSDLGTNAAAGTGPHVVVEADEYDRAFLSYHPDVAAVTNVEADHLDYYKTYEAVKEAFRGYAANVKPGGTLALCADNAEALALRDHVRQDVNVVTYGFAEDADWRAADVSTRGLGQSFMLYRHGEPVRRFEIALPIRHNVQNALGALVVCHTLGLGWDEIATGLAGYRGVKRRFELVGEAGGVLVYDDYAHHPTEIADTAVAAKDHFPGHRIVALFQPHTYARSRYLLAEFRRCFEAFDRLFILETYAAREAIADGMTAKQLSEEITSPPPTYCETFESAAEAVAADLRPADVFFTVGAGDVDSVGPMVLDLLKTKAPR